MPSNQKQIPVEIQERLTKLKAAAQHIYIGEKVSFVLFKDGELIELMEVLANVIAGLYNTYINAKENNLPYAEDVFKKLCAVNDLNNQLQDQLLCNLQDKQKIAQA